MRKKYSRFRYKAFETSATSNAISIAVRGETATGGGGTGTARQTANTDGLELGANAGIFSFVESNESLYYSDGNGWYKITLINTDPSITVASTSVSLGASGNTALVSYTYNEPEGTPVSITVANSGMSLAQGNVVHYSANQTVEINNFAAEGSEWSGTVDLSVSDGVNIGTATINVDVQYADRRPGGVIASSTGTRNWTVPDGVTEIAAVAIGGGGGGSASTSASNGFSGGGGNGGDNVRTGSTLIPVTPGETLSVVVGAGGSGGTGAGFNNAASGGESGIKRGSTWLIKASGGRRGTYNSAGRPSANPSCVIPSGGYEGSGGLGGGGVSGNESGGGGGAGGWLGDGGDGGTGTGNGTAGQNGGGGGAGGVNSVTANVTQHGGGSSVHGNYDLSGTIQNGGTTPSGAGQADHGGDGGYYPLGNGYARGGGGSGAEDDSGNDGGSGLNGIVRICWGYIDGVARDFSRSATNSHMWPSDQYTDGQSETTI